MKRGPIVLAAVLLLAGGAGAWWYRQRPTAAPTPERPAQGAPVQRVVPVGTRIRVEVLNTTMTRGAARRVSLYLRDAGFDVVKFAGEGPQRDSTVVLDRTGHPEWARLASKALGGAAIESRPDSSRYVDITVLIGRVVRTPPEAFYP